MISILIATKDRPQKLLTCLHSIFVNQYKHFEIIIIDQSKNSKTQDIFLKLGPVNRKLIHYYRVPYANKSKALNFALTKTKYHIIAFTDDDCIVHTDWLNKINLFFQSNPNIGGVFGQAKPYLKSKKSGQIVPSCFMQKNATVTCNPYIIQYQKLGHSNNMILRKAVIESAGYPYFQEWLGDGSICKAGGIENELIFRILKKGYPVAFEPTILVYHDRWLSRTEENKLQIRYTTGYMAFLAYHLIFDLDINILFLIRAKIKERLWYPSNEVLNEFLYIIQHSLGFIQGTCIGIAYAFKNRLLSQKYGQ